MNKVIYQLVLLFFSVFIASCQSDFISLEESDPEVPEIIIELNDKIQAHNKLEKTVADKERLVSENDLVAQKLENYIAQRNEVVKRDIQIATGEPGLKVPAVCSRCKLSTPMCESSFDKLAGKYHKGGFLSVKGNDEYKFLNSCPICNTNIDNDRNKIEITERKTASYQYIKELRQDKRQLKKSGKYVSNIKTSNKIIKKLSNRKLELKELLNREREEKLAAIQEAKREKLQRERVQKEKEEIEKEMKKQAISTAQLLVTLGVSAEIIAEKTGLSKEEIDKIF